MGCQQSTGVNYYFGKSAASLVDDHYMSQIRLPRKFMYEVVIAATLLFIPAQYSVETTQLQVNTQHLTIHGWKQEVF